MVATSKKSPMNLAFLIHDYVVYNSWANQKLVAWLKTKPADLIEWEVPSSFPSIRLTLLHIWDTQRFWMSVLSQSAKPQSFRNGFDGTVQDIFEGIMQQSEAFSSYAQSLTEEQLTADCILETPWVNGVRPRFEFIQHCVNHSTYHRGQLVTIGRNLGFTDAPMTDYCFYKLMG
jgi:uncharacterized damage-inducible protein DinB